MGGSSLKQTHDQKASIDHHGDWPKSRVGTFLLRRRLCISLCSPCDEFVALSFNTCLGVVVLFLGDGCFGAGFFSGDVWALALARPRFAGGGLSTTFSITALLGDCDVRFFFGLGDFAAMLRFLPG